MTGSDPAPAEAPNSGSATRDAPPSGKGAAPSDAELVEAISRGRLECLTTLHDRYAGLTLAVAQRMLGDRAQAEDAVQNLFVQIWRHAHTYDPRRGSVRTWMLVRLRSRILTYLGSARVRRETSADEVSGVPEAIARPEPIEAFADRHTLVRSLARLSEPQRTALELAYFEGLSCSEIAERTGVPLGTVKSRLSGGLQKLKRALRPEESR